MLRRALVLVVILATAPRITLGQDGEDEIIQKLMARVEALDREVAAIKQTGATVEGAAQPEPATLVPKQEPAAAVELPSPEPEASRFTFHGYSDAGFERNLDGASVKRFVLGEVELFGTARISPKLRGSWLQTALTRPMLFTFEDDGGFLPLHNVGLSANGKLPSGDLGLHYVVEVGSSRNYAQPGRPGFHPARNPPAKRA